jgi:hypothetical protein
MNQRKQLLRWQFVAAADAREEQAARSRRYGVYKVDPVGWTRRATRAKREAAAALRREQAKNARLKQRASIAEVGAVLPAVNLGNVFCDFSPKFPPCVPNNFFIVSGMDLDLPAYLDRLRDSRLSIESFFNIAVFLADQLPSELAENFAKGLRDLEGDQSRVGIIRSAGEIIYAVLFLYAASDKPFSDFGDRTFIEALKAGLEDGSAISDPAFMTYLELLDESLLRCCGTRYREPGKTEFNPSADPTVSVTLYAQMPITDEAYAAYREALGKYVALRWPLFATCEKPVEAPPMSDVREEEEDAFELKESAEAPAAKPAEIPKMDIEIKSYGRPSLNCIGEGRMSPEVLFHSGSVLKLT